MTTTPTAASPALQEGFRHYLEDVVTQWGKVPADTPIPLQALQDLQAAPANAFHPEGEDAQRFARRVFDEFGPRGHITQRELMDRLQEMKFIPTPETTPASKLAQASQREAAPTPQQAKDRKAEQDEAKRPQPAGRGFSLPGFGSLRKKSLAAGAEASFETALARTRDTIGKTNALLAEMPTQGRLDQEQTSRKLQKMVTKVNKNCEQLAKAAATAPGSRAVQQGMEALGKDIQGLGKNIQGSPLSDDIKAKMDDMLKELSKLLAALLSKLFNRGASPQPA